jgi:hypothetical protein
MSPALSRARRVLTIMCASVAVLGATALPASADSASSYLARETSLIGPCGGTYYTVGTTIYTADPNGWNSLSKYVRTDTGGNFETNVYRRSGVSRYHKDYACKNSSNWRRIDTPSKYVHQFIYQNWLCYGGSCQYLYTNYGSWVAGV